MRRFCANAALSAAVVWFAYLFLWKQRIGDWIVWLLEHVAGIGHEQAFLIYHGVFRGHRDVFFAAAMIFVFLLLLWRMFRWMAGYFKEIDGGIDALLAEDGIPVHLCAEMAPFERKLNAVKRTLEERKREKALAEQRKDELVMYLAHDIRTPLTSVIGYLSLLEQEPDMPAAARARRVHITLEKAYRLEEMINEFFEITRYNSGQMKPAKVRIDLYYMLVQLADEFSPLLAQHGNAVVLKADENISVCADPEQLARVFGNILRNAAAYSYPGTEITVFAEGTDSSVCISFQNEGDTIPADRLCALFHKFYRLDGARISDTGGAGLGLAIAKEIVTLHGGQIAAKSEWNTVTIEVCLPMDAP